MSDSDNIIQFPGKAKLVSVKTDKAYVAAEKVTVSRKKEPPKRTDVKTPLTNEHRKELIELVNSWVATSNLAKKPISYPKAYSLIYQDALRGEVNGINQIEESEFEICRKYIQQRIRILETVGNQRVMRRKLDWRRTRISAIHARLSELIKQGKVTEQRRKEYQLDRYEKESVADFSDDELEDYRIYLMQKNPKFTIPLEKIKAIQQDRENALRVLIGVMEANAKAKGQIFTPQRLNCPKSDMMEMLKQREPALFSGMSEDQFNKFWTKQSVCKLKPGKPLGSGKQ